MSTTEIPTLNVTLQEDTFQESGEIFRSVKYFAMNVVNNITKALTQDELQYCLVRYQQIYFNFMHNILRFPLA